MPSQGGELPGTHLRLKEPALPAAQLMLAEPRGAAGPLFAAEAEAEAVLATAAAVLLPPPLAGESSTASTSVARANLPALLRMRRGPVLLAPTAPPVLPPPGVLVGVPPALPGDGCGCDGGGTV